MADISITELPVGTMSADSIFPTSQPSAATGRVTTKLSGTEVGEGILGDIEYQGLNTVNKTMFGAINEMLIAGSTGVAVTGTLLAGDTTVTLSDNAIHVTSLIDIFTGVYGVVPSAVAVNEGSVTLTFTAQAQNLPVAIIVRGIANESDFISLVNNVRIATSGTDRKKSPVDNNNYIIAGGGVVTVKRSIGTYWAGIEIYMEANKQYLFVFDNINTTDGSVYFGSVAGDPEVDSTVTVTRTKTYSDELTNGMGFARMLSVSTTGWYDILVGNVDGNDIVITNPRYMEV